MELAHGVPCGKVFVTNLNKIQRRFTERLAGLQEMSYLQRLQQLHNLTLLGERVKSDLVLLFKCMHSINGMSLGELGT